MITAKELMKKRIICFDPEDSIFDVARIFAREDISGAPVVENDRLIGIVSISDIVKFMTTKMTDASIIEHDPSSLSFLLLNVAKMGKDYLDFKKEMERLSKTKVKDVMSKEVLVISPDTTLIEIAELMEKKDVNRLPVIERDKIIGMVSRADLLKALIE